MEKILFLCPHNAAKSILAAAHMENLVNVRNLSIAVESAGTEPDEAIMPSVLDHLAAEGIPQFKDRPTMLTQEQLDEVSKVVSIGCDLSPWAVDKEKLIEWDDVPAPSQNLAGASDLIHERVVGLIEELSA